VSLWKTGCDANSEKKVTSPRVEIKVESGILREALQECCSLRLNTGILQTNHNRICQGRFLEVGKDALTLETYPPEDLEFFPLSTCMVSWFLEGRAHVFISLVRECHAGAAEDSRELQLRFPDQMAVSQFRWAFRVPASGIPGLEVALHCPRGGIFRPELRDLSFGGMKVEFPASQDPDLCLGGRGQLTLAYENKVITLDAEVRRRDGHSYGPSFSVATTGRRSSR